MTQPNDIELSIVIPVKDEVDSISVLVKETIASLDEWRDERGNPRQWEMIFVDDGSIDDTWGEIVRSSTEEPRVRGLKLRRNFGKSAALAAGIELSCGRYIATLDGDLQDDPAELPGMVGALEASSDLVAGYKETRHDPWSKRAASKVFNYFTSLMSGLKLHDHNCGLKVGKREVFERVPLYGEMHRYLAAISHAQGFRVVEYPVVHRPRRFGRSKFGLERYARGGLDLITVLSLTRYTSRPAHLFGGAGLVLGLLGSAALGYLGLVWLFTDQPIGTRPLLIVGVLLVLVAVQLVSLGLVAEMMVSRRVAESDPLRHVSERANV